MHKERWSRFYNPQSSELPDYKAEWGLVELHSVPSLDVAQRMGEKSGFPKTGFTYMASAPFCLGPQFPSTQSTGFLSLRSHVHPLQSPNLNWILVHSHVLLTCMGPETQVRTKVS